MWLGHEFVVLVLVMLVMHVQMFVNAG